MAGSELPQASPCSGWRTGKGPVGETVPSDVSSNAGRAVGMETGKWEAVAGDVGRQGREHPHVISVSSEAARGVKQPRTLVVVRIQAGPLRDSEWLQLLPRGEICSTSKQLHGFSALVGSDGGITIL